MDSAIFWDAWHDPAFDNDGGGPSRVAALTAWLAAAVFPPADTRPAAARAEVVAETGRRYRAAVADPVVAGELATDSGTTPEMVAEVAGILFAPMTQDAMMAQWDAVPTGTTRPAVVFHVPAGNVYVSGLEYLALTVFVGASGIVRLPRRGGAAMRLWLRLVNEVDPAGQAGRWIMARWPRDVAAGGVTAAAAGRADVVVAMGSDATLSALAPAPAVAGRERFVGHGSRASLAVLGPGAVAGSGGLAGLADRVALDHSLHDQQGCLSPRAVVLAGWTPDAAGVFAAEVSAAMSRMATRLPRAGLSLPESAELARRRDETVLAGVLGDPCRVISPSGAPFLVTLAPAETFAGPGPANRYVEVLHSAGSRVEWPAAIRAAFAGHVSTVAVAGFERVAAEALARDLGGTRICAPGAMQSPPPGWCHDGNTGLGWLLGIDMPPTLE